MVGESDEPLQYLEIYNRKFFSVIFESNTGEDFSKRYPFRLKLTF